MVKRTGLTHPLQDDVVIFSAPTAYFLVADPHFGLSLIVTLCLTELANGIVKLYYVRPRPLWVSTKLQRKGTVWEKVGDRWLSSRVLALTCGALAFLTQDSSFPSSHAQSVATLFSFLFLEGKEHLPHTIWVCGTFVTGALTLLTGFSRIYLAMHFVSDVRYPLLPTPLVCLVSLTSHQRPLGTPCPIPLCWLHAPYGIPGMLHHSPIRSASCLHLGM